MVSTLCASFRSRLSGASLDDAANVPQIVDAILSSAREAAASDVHLVPAADAMHMHWRIDGVLQPIESLPRGIASNVVARLKVLADLLTYRTEIPQEGRVRTGGAETEMRVSTFPTLYGEKAVVRLFVGSGRFRRLADLALPADLVPEFDELLMERGGLLLVTGPAGSGKTTTVYACLRELVERESGRSLVSIEDPIEAVLDRVAQSQVQPAAGFTYESGLRSLLRQDPDVLLVGEIRDRVTAELVFQAALAGHLVLSTFHAGSSVGAMQRLIEMGIEPYQLRCGLLAVVSQRLLRRLCECAVTSDSPVDRQGLDVESVRVPAGCPRCRQTGYSGRFMLAELLRRRSIEGLPLSGEIREGAGSGTPSASLFDRAVAAVEAGTTSPAELRRVLGPAANR